MIKETLRITGLVAFYFAVALALPMCAGGCTVLRPYYPAASHFGACVAVCASASIAEVVKIRATQPASVTATPVVPK